MTRLIETTEQAVNRLLSAKGTLLFALFMAYCGNLMIITKRFSKGVSFLDSHWTTEGPHILIAGTFLTCVSAWYLWFAYFKRILRLLPHQNVTTYSFMILAALCLSVPFLEKFTFIKIAAIIHLTSLPFILVLSYFFHKFINSQILRCDKYKAVVKPKTVICCKCLNPFSGDVSQNLPCPKCGGKLEDLDGFYDRHPDLKENK